MIDLTIAPTLNNQLPTLEQRGESKQPHYRGVRKKDY